MACTINGTDIRLTRGDTLYLEITINRQDGTEYEIQEGDKVRFAMKKRISDVAPVLVKEIDPESLVMKIFPEDTKSLPMKSEYYYDIELTQANGDISTFISGKFTVMEEVH
jgi:hypothetical protein